MSNIDFKYQEETLKTKAPHISSKIENYIQKLVFELDKITDYIKKEHKTIKDLPVSYSAYLGYKGTNNNCKLTNISSIKISFYMGDLEKIFEINKTTIKNFQNIDISILETETDELENMAFNMICIHNAVTLQNIRNTLYWIFPPHLFTIKRNYEPNKGFFYIPKHINRMAQENRYIGDIYSCKDHILKIAEKMDENQFLPIAYENQLENNHLTIDTALKFHQVYNGFLEKKEIKELTKLSKHTFTENISYVTKNEIGIILIYKNQSNCQIIEFAILKGENIRPKIFFKNLISLIYI